MDSEVGRALLQLFVAFLASALLPIGAAYAAAMWRSLASPGVSESVAERALVFDLIMAAVAGQGLEFGRSVVEWVGDEAPVNIATLAVVQLFLLLMLVGGALPIADHLKTTYFVRTDVAVYHKAERTLSNMWDLTPDVAKRTTRLGRLIVLGTFLVNTFLADLIT